MEPLKINIVLPFFTTKPGGGTKVMYEYGNRLVEHGHEVTVLHSIKRPVTKIKSPVWWKQAQYKLRGLSRPPWFPLHHKVKSLIVPEITDAYVPDADIVLCTWWEMAFMVSNLSECKGKKFNLIQDYETWKGYEEFVHESYKLGVQNIVIAKYLEDLVGDVSGIKPIRIPNAIDTNRFRLVNSIAARDPLSVIMLYSEEERKGTVYGIEALIETKKRFHKLQVNLFGVYAKPGLPDWINYYQKPAALPELMNNNAVFLSPSLGEGWALPPAEAMACGCAIVCTDIGGHADYAFDNKTAFLTAPGNVNDIVDKLSLVLHDQPLRMRIAEEGNYFVTANFNWGSSVDKMEGCFYQALEQSVLVDQPV